jgi:hypothetical protein
MSWIRNKELIPYSTLTYFLNIFMQMLYAMILRNGFIIPLIWILFKNMSMRMLYSLILMIDLCNFQQSYERKNRSSFLINHNFILNNTNSAVPYLDLHKESGTSSMFLARKRNKELNPYSLFEKGIRNRELTLYTFERKYLPSDI